MLTVQLDREAEGYDGSNAHPAPERGHCPKSVSFGAVTRRALQVCGRFVAGDVVVVQLYIPLCFALSGGPVLTCWPFLSAVGSR